MRFTIIEDEPLAAEKLKSMIMELRPSWFCQDIIPSVRKAVQFLSIEKVDLIFLDVHLGDGNSFSIFEGLQLNIPIIFTTAFDKYALKAFQLNSVDYLLKPIAKDDLKRALDKFENLQKKEATPRDWQKLILDLKTDFKERFIVSTGKKIKSLKTEEIAYFFAQGKHTFITDKNGNEYLIDRTLSSLVEALDPKTFFHINRQYILSINCIKEMVYYSKGRLKIETEPKTSTDAIVSIDKAPKFKAWLEGE